MGGYVFRKGYIYVANAERYIDFKTHFFRI